MRTPWIPIALTALAFAPPAAAADANTELNDASKAVFAEAVDAAAKKEWATCRTKAIGVWQQIKNPKVAGVLGICEAELGLNKEAATHLDYFFEKEPNADPNRKKSAQERFDKVRPKLALVTVQVTPDDADLKLDGAVIDSDLRRIYVDPGEHTLSAAKAGMTTSQSVTGVAGGTNDVKLVVPSVGGAGAGGAGAQAAGAGGTGGSGAAGGAGGAGGGDNEPGDKPLWPTLTLAIVGAAGVGAGIGLTVVAQGKYDDAETTVGCTPPTLSCRDEAQGLLDDSAALQSGGIAAFAVGGAALVGMAIYLAIPASANKSVAVAPALSSTFQGLFIGGSF